MPNNYMSMYVEGVVFKCEVKTSAKGSVYAPCTIKVWQGKGKPDAFLNCIAFNDVAIKLTNVGRGDCIQAFIRPEMSKDEANNTRWSYFLQAVEIVRGETKAHPSAQQEDLEDESSYSGELSDEEDPPF